MSARIPFVVWFQAGVCRRREAPLSQSKREIIVLQPIMARVVSGGDTPRNFKVSLENDLLERFKLRGSVPISLSVAPLDLFSG